MNTVPSGLPRRHLVAGATAIGVLVATVFARSTRVGFLGDDLERIWRATSFDPMISGLAYPANHWRPGEDAVLWALDRAVGLEPVPHHAVNIALHLVVTLLVGVLAVHLARYIEHTRPSSGPWTRSEIVGAAAAALTFGLLPSHSEAVVWIAGRGDLLATTWVLVALLAWVRGAPRSAMALVVSSVAYAAALATKESAVALLGIVLVVELTRSRRPFTVRVGTAMRSIVSLAGITIVWIVVRWTRLGSLLGGFGDPVDTTSPLSYPPRWGALILRSLLPPAPTAVWLLVAAAFGVVGTFLAVRARRQGVRLGRRDLPEPVRTALCMAGCTAIAALPVAALGVSLRTTGGERLVYLPSVFAVIGVARLWRWWWERDTSRALLIGVVAVAVMTVATVQVQQRWVRSGEQAAELIEQLGTLPRDRPAVLEGIPDTLDGVEFMRNAVWPALVLVHDWQDPAVLSADSDGATADRDPDVPVWRWGDGHLRRVDPPN